MSFLLGDVHGKQSLTKTTYSLSIKRYVGLCFIYRSVVQFFGLLWKFSWYAFWLIMWLLCRDVMLLKESLTFGILQWLLTRYFISRWAIFSEILFSVLFFFLGFYSILDVWSILVVFFFKIAKHDEEALYLLNDIKSRRTSNLKGFELKFTFDTPNPYFKNNFLSKTYELTGDNESISLKAIG